MEKAVKNEMGCAQGCFRSETEAMKPIRVVLKRPGLPAEVMEISGTLEAFQKLLDDATLCAVRLTQGIHGYADDEGLLKELPLNFYLRGQPIVGPVFFSKLNGEREDIGFEDESEALSLCRLINSGTINEVDL